MAAVTLTRPLWWVARRSLRLLTGLILMALLLGLAAGWGEADAAPPGAAPAPPAGQVTAVAPAPAVDGSTAVPTPATAPPTTAATPVVSTVPGDTVHAVRAAGPTGSEDGAATAPAAVRVAVPVGEPDRWLVSHRTARPYPPAGPGHGLPSGERAPPRG